MEKYTTIKNEGIINVKQGSFYNLVHKKHIESYGDFGARNIRDNIVATYAEAIKQYANECLNNNILLVGKVQSGKTSNLELFTALAIDNGFNLIVIYGGYDNTLLSQTMNRFKKTFDIPNDLNYSDNMPVVFSSDDSTQLLSIDNEIIEDLIDANKPIFIISMKRPSAMNKVNDLLERIDKTRLKAFIIDDEGDQASLNTKKNKASDASATYAAIVNMKNHLNNPLYLSVTATPQANIFLNDYSALRPDSIRLIEPGKGYCGAELYHLYDSEKVEIVDANDQQQIEEGKMPESIKKSINHYIIASAILKKIGLFSSDMIIHSHRNVDQHSVIYRLVNNYIQQFRDIIEYGNNIELTSMNNEFKKTYEKLFTESIQTQFKFVNLIDEFPKIIRRIYIILKNSGGRATQATESYRKHKIYIGGDLLQRGVTFPHLTTIYFTRWAMDGGNMDTNLQRARWFGYREKYIDVCKIFTTESISREFTTLSEMEADLWEQFYSIQNGEMNISDILIQAENTKQRPTRKNVADYNSISFKNKWIKQRIGLFDSSQINHNNTIVNNLIGSMAWNDSSAGRKDTKPTAKYAVVSKNNLKTLINQMQLVFDLEPFEKRPLEELISSDDDIPVILMGSFDKGRERSFYQDNKIYALHQGADNKDSEKAIYLGDSHVIVDKDKINIQIHKIIPKKKDMDGNGKVLNECTQYMFAIYVPKKKTYFVRG